MIITFFRKFTLSNIIVLLILLFFMRAVVLMSITASGDVAAYESSYNHFFNNWAINPTAGLRINIMFTAILVFLQAILLNRIITRNNLFHKTSYLPALMYVVLASMFTPFISFSPVVICNFFLLWLFERLLQLYKGAYALRFSFDIGLIIGVASLFYFPFIYLFPIVWYSLFIYRSFGWREWVVPIIGIIIPYILIFTWFFWNDNLPGFLQIWQIPIITLPQKLNVSAYDSIALIPLTILMVLAFFQIRVNFLKNVVQVRKSQLSLLFLSLLILLSFFFTDDKQITHFMMMAVPLSVFLSYYFINARVKWFYETLFALLLISIFYFQVV